MANKPDNTRKLSADKIVVLPLAEIRPYDKNPRKNSGAVKYVKESIRQFGFKVPIVIDSNRVVVCGHTRLLAAKSLGMTEVPCIMADDLTDYQIKAFRLADNKVGEFAEWDIDLLGDELDAIADASDIDMEALGFDLSETEDETEVVEDEVPEEVEPVCQRGEIWKLGEHRLMCGDATDPSTYDKLMDGKKADLVFTDPPYGMKKENEGVLNDNLNFDDLLEFNKRWIPLTFANLKDNGSWYCWGIDEPLMDIYSEILRPMKKRTGAEKLTFRNLITWDKGVAQGQKSESRRKYPTADEKCLFVMMGRQAYGETIDDYWDGFEPIRLSLVAIRDRLKMSTEEFCKVAGASTCSHWFARSQWEFPSNSRFFALCDNCLAQERIDRAEYDKIRAEYDKIRAEYDKIRAEFYSKRAYFDNTHDNMNNVWHFDRTSAEEREGLDHATPKPLALCARAIKSSSREGEIVLDVFGGSGSTMIACEQLGRKCRMMELDPHYCDVIIARWEKLTGQKAVKVED